MCFYAMPSSQLIPCETPAPSLPTSVISKPWRHVRLFFLPCMHRPKQTRPWVRAEGHFRATMGLRMRAGLAVQAKQTPLHCSLSDNVGFGVVNMLSKTLQPTVAAKRIKPTLFTPTTNLKAPRPPQHRFRARSLQKWASQVFAERVHSVASIGNAWRLTERCILLFYVNVKDFHARMVQAFQS